MTQINDLISIAEKFAIEGEVATIEPLVKGLINDTFKVTMKNSSTGYILQRINTSIFQDVELLQHNIEAATGHIRKKLEFEGASDIDRKVLTVIYLKDGSRSWFRNESGFWRMTLFIPDTISMSEVTPETSYLTGRAIGKFELQLSDIEETLGETIPDFHNMELRSRQLKEAAANDPVGRMSDPEVQSIYAFLQEHDEAMCKAERLFREGKLPKRICHCDTKVNNILFDKDGNALCVIDLDTLMPGFIFSDFGDFMRTGASTLPEDDPAFEKVEFRMDIYESFKKGYLETATFLTPVEIENLPYAAARFAYMQAVRFFADYINGDTYYRVAYKEHNLVRTRNQVALFKSILSKFEGIE